MITLTREEAQQVLDALDNILDKLSEDCCDEYSLWEQYQIAADVSDDIRARLAQPEPEPVADKYLMEVECTKCGAKQDGVLTVTAPPQREWQGLTDEELLACYSNRGNVFYRAIEAKLKEKNT